MDLDTMSHALDTHAHKHGRGVESKWQPPPRAWHKIWLEGTAEMLPYGLLSPASDYIWRVMWQQPVYLTSREIEAKTRCPYEQIKNILRMLVKYGCAVPMKMGGSAQSHYKETRHRMERTTDYLSREYCRIEYRPIRPETTTAMHLRWLHQQPTPDCPPYLPIQQRRLWMLLAANAIGRAAVLNIKTAAEEVFGRANNSLRAVLGDLRNRGLITRLYGCQMSVFRLTGHNRLNKQHKKNGWYED